MDNLNPAFVNSGTQPIDDLIAAVEDLVGSSIVLKSGAGSLVRGCLLGKIVADTLTATGTKPIAGGANTGNATIGAVTGGTKVKPGTYVILFTAATAFMVYDPEGNNVGPAGATGTAFVSQELNFTITAGGTPMVAGDGFTVAVTGSGKYLKAIATATDGSAEPKCVLAQDTDATSADQTTGGYERGVFNENVINTNSDASVANPISDSTRLKLRKLGIFLKVGQSN